MRSAVAILFLASLISGSYLGRAQAAAPTAAATPDDAAKTAAQNATTAVTNAQAAAGSAQTSAGQAGNAANEAKKSADNASAAAEKAASAADAVAKSLKTVSPPASPRGKAKVRPLGDYVPCLFDEGQVYDLRAQAEPSQQLTQAKAQTAVNTAKNELISTAPAGAEGDPIRNFANNNITTEALTSSTASVSDVSLAILATATKNGIDPTKVTSAANKAQQAVTGGTFDRPPDVSCSFSIMQWQETRDTFGRRVANQYVAIEVNVRNLNDKNDFLIHDVQIAVDTGLNRAQFGRFQAGRDKQIVRAVIQRGQTEDFRNLAINSLLMMGAIAGGASAAVTSGLSSTAQANDFSTAVAIFQGPLTTGLINIFPDHTIDHINHVNDLGFSASSSNKTIVPVQGSVPLVTFLAQKPLEQLPWAHCGEKTIASNNVANSVCSIDTDPVSFPPDSATGDYYDTPVRFRKWNPLALAVLERHVFVIIAGVHIKDVADTPTITSVTCAPGNSATIALAKITDPNVTCTLKGTDLDLVSRVELQNATDTTDKTQVEGTSSVSGDTTQSTVLFNPKDLTGLKGTTYTLYYSLKGGTPQKTSLTVTVQQVISVNPTSLAFSSQSVATPSNPQTITLTNNGNQSVAIKSVDVTGPQARNFVTPLTGSCVGAAVQVPATQSCTINVTFTPVDSGSITATVSVADDGAGSPQTVTLSGTGK
jgi:hypothetical protein